MKNNNVGKLGAVKCIGHQGDCTIYEIDEFPDTHEVLQDKQTQLGIIAYGEVTGHAHQFAEPDAVEVYKGKPESMYSGLLFVKTLIDNANLIHGKARDFIGQEADHDYHNPVTFQPGKKYMIGIVHETDWVTKTIRKVTD